MSSPPPMWIRRLPFRSGYASGLETKLSTTVKSPFQIKRPFLDNPRASRGRLKKMRPCVKCFGSALFYESRFQIHVRRTDSCDYTRGGFAGPRLDDGLDEPAISDEDPRDGSDALLEPVAEPTLVERRDKWKYAAVSTLVYRLRSRNAAF